MRNIPICLLALVWGPALAAGSVIVDLVDDFGHDSGWSVVLPDNIHADVVVDSITGVYVRLEVFKVLDDSLGTSLAPHSVEFRQRLDDAHTVTTIQITDETVVNAGSDTWTEYCLTIAGTSAAFDKAATAASGFSVEPFTAATWGAAPVGWAATFSGMLVLSGGSVAPGEVFSPGASQGRLYIQASLAGDSPAQFELRQWRVPEPATVGLLMVGAAALLRHARRNLGV
jgi:hypothetical protein